MGRKGWNCDRRVDELGHVVDDAINERGVRNCGQDTVVDVHSNLALGGSRLFQETTSQKRTIRESVGESTSETNVVAERS